MRLLLLCGPLLIPIISRCHPVRGGCGGCEEPTSLWEWGSREGWEQAGGGVLLLLLLHRCPGSTGVEGVDVAGADICLVALWGGGVGGLGAKAGKMSEVA